MPISAGIVADHPTVPVIVQHLANVFTWPQGIEDGLRLVLPGAEVPNLYVKVSSVMSNSPVPWEYPHADRLPVIQRFRDEWGADRLIWASDSPVSRHKGLSYQQTLELVRTHCTFFTPDELAGVLGGNLTRIFGLSPGDRAGPGLGGGVRRCLMQVDVRKWASSPSRVRSIAPRHRNRSPGWKRSRMCCTSPSPRRTCTTASTRMRLRSTRGATVPSRSSSPTSTR